MVKTFDKNAQRMKRHTRVRGKISGTPERPRLNVYRSNANIYAQIIDDVNGVGYKASKEGNKLVMNLGYSHLVTMEEIEGITIDVPAPNKVVIHGIDKQKVGQFAANVRAKRPPEPYKGKGIKYANEVIRHKEGKAGGKK